MLRKFGVYLVWSVFCGLVVFIGFLFLFIPGIYIGISFTFGSYLLILRDNGLGKIITESMAMVKGNWWKTFGFILVMYLLVGVVAYLFGIPYMFVMMSSAFTGAIPNFTRLLSRCYFLIWDNIRYTRFCLSGSGCFSFPVRKRWNTRLY